MADVSEQIRVFIAEQTKRKPEDIADSAELNNDLGLDSLDLVELVVEIEEKWDIKISNEDAKKFTNISGLVKYIEEKISSE